MADSKLEIVFMPPLLQLLILSENNKGSLLTQEEVLNIRDNAIDITVSKERAKKLEIARGYKDINPERCWDEWCLYKENSFSETVN
ncbi:hypothetical protein [Rickettsia endosymbiont of Halotydeus destructor]|uniref:hypothetical protein n=1 Tax=Rickettsia endosymbiont of Halotydeus destructor TaxID=2996754 RepID=UPI003BAEB150